MEILELKSTLSEMKYSLAAVKSRLEIIAKNSHEIRRQSCSNSPIFFLAGGGGVSIWIRMLKNI